MKELMNILVRPDFMQTMLVSTLLCLLPLKKRPHWKQNALLVSAAGLAVGVALTVLVSSYHWTTPLLLLYYPAPLVVAFLLLLVCHAGSWQEALYGTGCAYATQHIAVCLSIILWGEQPVVDVTPSRIVGGWLLHLAAFGLCYWFLLRKLPEEGEYRVSGWTAVLTAGSVLFIAMFLNRIVRQVWESVDITTYSICMAYDLVSCLLILLLQVAQRRESALRAEVQTERRLRQQMKAQYALSRENIDIINRKSHDLKHQISALRLVQDPAAREASLQEIEQSVLIYDTSARTGNEVLDTVLTEKGLLCRENGISWTYMADGRMLDFLSPVDLYTLLGNALDNAIESSRSIPDPERRVVRLSVREVHGAAVFQVENYYDHPIQLVDDLPQTTKGDTQNHGYGLKSIRSIAERYGGTMDIEVGKGTFLLTVLIPLPKEEGSGGSEE